MKTSLIVLLLLAGCSTAVPVKRSFPDVPAALKEECPELNKINDGAKLSEIVGVVSKNYGQYHECRIKTEAWIEWYDKQKQIFEEVK
jgi:hypothetical protein